MLIAGVGVRTDPSVQAAAAERITREPARFERTQIGSMVAYRHPPSASRLIDSVRALGTINQSSTGVPAGRISDTLSIDANQTPATLPCEQTARGSRDSRG